jgi:PD-(D/E)XK nuclease superfamily
MLRTSERTTFKRCRWLWKLEFVDLRKPNFDTPPLMFGSMIHIALAAYYKKGIKRGPSPVDGFYKAIADEVVRVSNVTGELPHLIEESWRDRIEMGVGMMENYIDTYGSDDEWKVLATELPFQVIVTHPRDGITPWFWYTGILDLLVENRSTAKKMIWDHKTTAAIQTRYLALDEQTTSYWTWGVEALRHKGLIGQNEQIDGLMFNFLRKAKPDERPFRIENGKKYYLNKPTKTHPEGEVSKSQPPAYFLRHPVWRHNLQKERSRDRVIAEMLDMKAVRNEPERGAYKNNGKFTCAGCWAIDICELHEIGADYESLIAQTTRRWDPYEAHEIYFGEAR